MCERATMRLPLAAPTGTRYVENDKTVTGHSSDGEPLPPPHPNDWREEHYDGTAVANCSHGFYDAMAGVYIAFMRELDVIQRWENGKFEKETFVNEFGDVSPLILFQEEEAAQLRRDLSRVTNEVDDHFRRLKTGNGQAQVNNPEAQGTPEEVKAEDPYRVQKMAQALRNLVISTLQDYIEGPRLLNQFITANERESDNVEAVNKILTTMDATTVHYHRGMATRAFGSNWEAKGLYVARNVIADTIRLNRPEGVYPFEVEIMAQIFGVMIYVYDRTAVDIHNERHAHLSYIRADNFIDVSDASAPVMRVSIGQHVESSAKAMQYSFCVAGRADTPGRRYKRTVKKTNVVAVRQNPLLVIQGKRKDGTEKTVEEIEAERARRLEELEASLNKSFRYQLQRWGGRPDFDINRELLQEARGSVKIYMNAHAGVDGSEVAEGEDEGRGAGNGEGGSSSGSVVVPRRAPSLGGSRSAGANSDNTRVQAATARAAEKAAREREVAAREVLEAAKARSIAQKMKEQSEKARLEREREEEREIAKAKRMEEVRWKIKDQKYRDKRVIRHLPSQEEETKQAWTWATLKANATERGAYKVAVEMMEEHGSRMDAEMFERVRYYEERERRYAAAFEEWQQRQNRSRKGFGGKFALEPPGPMPWYLQRWSSERVAKEWQFTRGRIWLYYNGEVQPGTGGPRNDRLTPNSKPTATWVKMADKIAHTLWLRYKGRVLPEYKKLLPEMDAKEETALRLQRAADNNALRGHLRRPTVPHTGLQASTPQQMHEVTTLRCQTFESLYTSANIFQDPRLTYIGTLYTVDEQEALQVEYEDFMAAERKHLMNILKDCQHDATEAQLNWRYEEDSRSFAVCDDPSTTMVPVGGNDDGNGPVDSREERYAGERVSREPLAHNPFESVERVWKNGFLDQYEPQEGETKANQMKRLKDHEKEVMSNLPLWTHPDFPGDINAQEVFEEVLNAFLACKTAAEVNAKKGEASVKALFDQIAKVGFPVSERLPNCSFGRMPRGPNSDDDTGKNKDDAEPGYYEAMLRWWRFDKELSADGRKPEYFDWQPFLDADPLMGFAHFMSQGRGKTPPDQRNNDWKLPPDFPTKDANNNPLPNIPSLSAWQDAWGNDAEEALLLKVLREYLNKAIREDPSFARGPGEENGWIGSFYKTFDVQKMKKGEPMQQFKTDEERTKFVTERNLMPIVKTFRSTLLAIFPEIKGTTGLNGIMEFVNWFHQAAWPSDGSEPIRSDAEFDVRQLDALCQILCLPMISTWKGFSKRPDVKGVAFYEEHKTRERILLKMKDMLINLTFVRRALDYAASYQAFLDGGVLHKPKNAKVLKHWRELTKPVSGMDDRAPQAGEQQAERRATAMVPQIIEDSEDSGEEGETGEGNAN